MAINYKTGEITYHTTSESKYWDERIGTLDREELEAFQLKELQKTVKHAYENSVYY